MRDQLVAFQQLMNQQLETLRQMGYAPPDRFLHLRRRLSARPHLPCPPQPKKNRRINGLPLQRLQAKAALGSQHPYALPNNSTSRR